MEKGSPHIPSMGSHLRNDLSHKAILKTSPFFNSDTM